MPETLDWKEMMDLSARLLVERTGEDVAAWNRRIQAENPPDEAALRAWLSGQGVTGYAQTLLVMERYGYPDFYTASAAELIDGQFADRPHLRPVYDAVIDAAAGLGPLVVQARKTYVSLLTPRRTFVRLQASRTHLNVGLRLEGQSPGGRLAPSKIHASMPVQLTLVSAAELDGEALDWMKRAYDLNK
jgi:hypothetical protein